MTSAEVSIIYEAMLEEAAKWRRLSDEMRDVWQAVDFADLVGTAFMLPTTAGTVPGMVDSLGYIYYQDWMKKLAMQAVTEFDQIGQAIEDTVSAYQTTDQASAAALNLTFVNVQPIYGTKPED